MKKNLTKLPFYITIVKIRKSDSAELKIIQTIKQNWEQKLQINTIIWEQWRKHGKFQYVKAEELPFEVIPLSGNQILCRRMDWKVASTNGNKTKQ